MNDNLNPLRRANLSNTGDILFIGKARDLNRALYGIAERAVGRAPSQEPFTVHPEVLARMENAKS